MPRSKPTAALVLALARGVAGAKRASKAAAAAAAQAAQADTTWRIAVIVTLFVLVLTLLALNHVTRPFKFWGFSRAAAPFNGGDPKPPKPEPPTPFDEARTRRMKRMFQKYATRDDDGMIAASNLGELFADCGHAVPSAEELQGLLNRYPSHNDRDEAVGAVVKIGFEAFLKMAKFLEDEEQRKQGETTFFGQIYQQFVSSNNLAAMAGESS